MSTDDDMPGSHAANQSKTESMPPSQGHADPDAAPAPATVEVPSLDSISVGAGDPQAPSHAAAGDRGDRGASGVPALEAPVIKDDQPVHQLPTAPAGATTGRTDGLEQPAQGTDGQAHRTPGSLGATGDDEQIDTDVARSAANTNVTGTPETASGPGDSQGVPAVSGQAAPGTSEESAVAEGSRTPL